MGGRGWVAWVCERGGVYDVNIKLPMMPIMISRIQSSSKVGLS